MSNLNDGVGKKIVEALKKQSEIETTGISNPQSLEPENLGVDVSAIDEITNNGLFTEDNSVGEEPILKKLISQLPSGVTRHTGAQIIKQTMEALGISMKSVLTEAQEVQNNLKESSKECQITIQEYKHKIAALEKQTQNYQKQYSALNDLISLFIQTTK